MALTATGGSLALVSAGNGKMTVQWKNGNPVFDDSQDELVFSLLRESAWWGDRAKLRRSQIPSVKTKDSGTARKFEQYARDALQPGIDDGRLQSVSPTAVPAGLGFDLFVPYVTGGGQKRAVTVPLGG